MALYLLKRLAEGELPVTVTDVVEVAALKGLESIGCVRAQFVADDEGRQACVVHEITTYGRTVLKATKPHATPAMPPTGLERE